MAKKTSGPFSAELLDTLLEGRDAKTVLDSGLDSVRYSLMMKLAGPAPH